MPWRLRLYDPSGQLLVATDHETLEESGAQEAEFPVGEWGSINRELVFIAEDGTQRPATIDEDTQHVKWVAHRWNERGYEETPPCPRCGLKSREQKYPFPVRPTPAGPICFGCWTDEERKDLPPGFENLPHD